MVALRHLMDEELFEEIEQARADVARYRSVVRRPWNEQQRDKARIQLAAAERSLARLQRMAAA